MAEPSHRLFASKAGKQFISLDRSFKRVLNRKRVKAGVDAARTCQYKAAAALRWGIAGDKLSRRSLSTQQKYYGEVQPCEFNSCP